MASGIPVVASRIGGLPFTVLDGVTGLLADPGDPVDLARQIAKLLDDPPLRLQMGIAGRRRFEQEFTWESVIERYYRPLLARSDLSRRAGTRKSTAVLKRDDWHQGKRPSGIGRLHGTGEAQVYLCSPDCCRRMQR